ncbi:MAG: hypothetical protein IV097_05955 [Burkholderiaceae bacterium]|nr:hypothetical protein [Burkholderiaceae bacterium]
MSARACPPWPADIQGGSFSFSRVDGLAHAERLLNEHAGAVAHVDDALGDLALNLEALPAGPEAQALIASLAELSKALRVERVYGSDAAYILKAIATGGAT